jgi:sphinganine-1-phosphate aldolase
MVSLGRAGYAELVAGVMATTRRLQHGIAARTPFRVVGAPPMGVFAVACDNLSVPAVASAMDKRGWWIDTQDGPPALHFVVFPRHAEVVDRLLDDLEASVAEAATLPEPAGAASYGVMVRSGGITEQVLREHLDRRFDGAV